MCYPVGMSALDTYAPDRIGYRYGTPDSAYSKGYHRGQDVRKLNEAGTASVVTDVEAIDDGVVVYVGRPNGLLAWTVVIDTGRAKGRYESHSHMADISVGVGQRVSSGDRLGRNASMGEDHGFIDGVHDHVTITDRFDGAWVTWLDEYDPLPFMQAAYARATQGGNAAAGTDARSFNRKNPTLQEEDDMAGLIQHKDRGIALVAPGYFKAVTPEELPIAVDRYGWPKVYDDSQVGAREFDLDVSLAVNGAGGDQQVRSELERSRDAVLKAINGMRGSV